MPGVAAVKSQGRNQSAVAGIAQVMVSACLWGTVGVSTRLVPSAAILPQEELGLARLAVGGPALLVLLVLVARVPISSILRLHPFWLASFAMGCAVFQVCLFQSFTLLGVTTTVFLTVCLPPLMGTALDFLRGDRSLAKGALLALGLAVAGLGFFAAGSMTIGADGLNPYGLVLAIIASAAFVLMTSAARRLTQSAGPLLVAGAGLTLAALILLVMLHLFRPDQAPIGAMAGWDLAGLVFYLGLGPTALAYVLFCAGMARCRSANLGLVASMVEPAFAALLAWFLLNERLTQAEVLGCGFVMAAMLTLWESERRLKADPAQPLGAANRLEA